MFDLIKKVDNASGTVTYSRTIGGHTASVIASCEEEAKGKLGSDLLCALGLDGIITAVECQVNASRKLAISSAKNETMVYKDELAEALDQIEELQHQIVNLRAKSWWQVLKDSFWRR
jgi:hypothetical protein